jgi:hypothetical protein
MEQAVISIDGHTFGKTYIPDEFTEKFAELIVRECAQQIDVYKMMKLDPSFYGGMLRDHFKDKENNDGQV